MTKKIGVGKAHSKIILIGEHAVVYGYPAISLPLLEVEVTCRVLPAETPWRLFEEDTLSMAIGITSVHQELWRQAGFKTAQLGTTSMQVMAI